MAIMDWFGPPRRIAAAIMVTLTVWVMLVEDVHCQQPGISVGCLSVLAKHNSTASSRPCLLRYAENLGIRSRGRNGNFTAVLTEDQLEFACGSSNCLDVFVEIAEACEVCNE